MYPHLQQKKGNIAPGLQGCMVSPPTTDFALVFPLDRTKRKFDKSFYSPALTDGRMSTEQLKIFLKDIEKIVKKKLRPIKAVMIAYFMAMFIGVFSLFVSLVDETDDYNFNDLDDSYNTTTTASDNTDYDLTYDDTFDSFICSFFVFFFLLMIGGILLQAFIKNRHRKARKCAQSIIDNHHHIFAAQGLRWNLSMGFPHWIELWKDYKGQTNFAPVQNTNYGVQAPLQILQKQHIMPTLTSQVGYPIFSMPPMPIYQSNLSNLSFNQQPAGNQRNGQEQEQNQYVPPSLNNANPNNA